ncbi:hypothetical protein [Emcibacter sp. SYSU 3D8]|uniref:hypothetical protein n=1 Tax=Emcibacter sp. SYSU 3D8 TaxID=3133969 RepID=UPI0031FE7318
MWLTVLRWAGAHRVALAVAAAVLALAGIGWAVWSVRQAGYEAGKAEVQARWDEAGRAADQRARAEERLVQQAVDAIGARLSVDLARLRIEHRTINRRIVDEVHSVPVYSECRLTERVWRDLNHLRATTDPGASAGSGAAVPAVAAGR